MIYIDKQYNVYLKNCSGSKTNILKRGDHINEYHSVLILTKFLDHNIELEEGFSLRDYFEFIKLWKLYVINEIIEEMIEIYDDIKDKDECEDNREYISIINKYDVFIERNICKIERKLPDMKVVDVYGDLEYLFVKDLSFKNILDLEIRIEEDIIEYIDMKFVMDRKINLLEFIYCIMDCLVTDY